MSIRTYLFRARLRILLAAHSLLRRLLARRRSPRPASHRAPACPPPEMTFVIEDGVAYTPELQRWVADCMRRANDDFIAYAVGKLRHDGTIARDWPTHITVTVQRDHVSWALVSRSGHRFAATSPDAVARHH